MKDLLLKLALNWFYTLELSQVDLYLNQAKRSKDEYIARILVAVAEIELNHAQGFEKFILELGGHPVRLGEIFSYLSGYIPGRLTNYFGTVNLFTYNYTLETIAIRDYRSLISRLDPVNDTQKRLLEFLINNLVEEDFHRSWFLSEKEKLKKIKKKNKP